MMQALQGTGSFSNLSTTRRRVALGKGIIGVLEMYVTHELEDAIEAAETGAVVSSNLMEWVSAKCQAV